VEVEGLACADDNVAIRGLKRGRQARGLRQREVALAARMNQPVVSDIERGRAIPSADESKRLA
jgi:transcriptional regulator with XRE-family HTH domain